MSQSLQERFAPSNQCFGCGPSNPKGLRIRSFPAADDPERVECDWKAEPHHIAFPGAVNGGVLGALLDCHSNWTAAWHLMRKAGASAPPCTVTSEFLVKLKRPTPLDATLHLSAKVVESSDDRATVEAEIRANDKVTATCRGSFVAVEEGHPAFHRW